MILSTQSAKPLCIICIAVAPRSPRHRPGLSWVRHCTNTKQKVSPLESYDLSIREEMTGGDKKEEHNEIMRQCWSPWKAVVLAYQQLSRCKCVCFVGIAERRV